MSHIPVTRLHGLQNRGLDLRISVATSESTEDFTAITFRTEGVEKPDLDATDTASGFDVDFTLSAEDIATVGTFLWELTATFGGTVRTLAYGRVTVDPEPTQEESP